MKKSEFTKEIFFDLTNFRFADIFDDINFIWEVLPKIANYLTSRIKEGHIGGNFDEKKKIYLGDGTIVQEGSKIIGPAITGRNCVISHASLIRENCLFGDNVHIGHAVEVKNSIFLNNVTAAHLSYIGDSIIGNNVNISGGAMLANFRLDKKPVVVRTKEGRVDTGLTKFGSVIGDGSNIGVNSVLNPGTILGRSTIVYPLVSVTGLHKNNEVLR